MLLSVAEYAKHRGIALGTVYYALRTGRIVRRADNLIDAAEADKVWGQRRHSERGEGRPVAVTVPQDAPAAKISFTDARTERELWEGKLKELRYKERSGELVEARAVEVAAENRHRMLRQTIMQIPDRLAPVLANESDERKVHEIITGELRAILDDFSKGRMG
jgi:hypothetical protein